MPLTKSNQKSGHNRPNSSSRVTDHNKVNEAKYLMVNVLTEDNKREQDNKPEKGSNTKQDGGRKNTGYSENVISLSDLKKGGENNLFNPIPITFKNYYADFPNYEATKCSLNSLHYIKAYAANTYQGIVR